MQIITLCRFKSQLRKVFGEIFRHEPGIDDKQINNQSLVSLF